MHFGFIPETRVLALRRAPAGDPTVYCVGGAEIALRRETPELTDPRLDRVATDCDEKAGWLVVRRGPVVIAANLSGGTWTCPAEPPAGLLAASDPRVELTAQGLVLPPDSVAILNKATGP